MKLQDIYELAIELGKEADPRGKEAVDLFIKETKETYEKLPEDEKTYFDLERLKNPYSDTRILAGDPNKEVENVLAGIDMEVPELVLADRLREKGKIIDLVIAHHPEGKALAALDQVMGMQADIWHQFGVPINIGDVLIDKRAKEVQRTLSPINHNRAIDVADLLDLPLICVHTPADNLVSRFLQKFLDEKAPYRVKDLVHVLHELPEYQAAARINAGPHIIVGSGTKRAGKILVMMTGGTGGPKDSIEKLAAAGVGTLVEMHLDEKLRKKAEEHGLNVVIAGHIASDSIGVNLLLDKLEQRGLKIMTCSGLIRVRRN